MKKIAALVLALVLATGIGGCASVQNAYNVASGSAVSPTAVYIARNSFDAVEVTATNYIVYCKVHPSTTGCSKTAIAQLIPAVRSGRVARNNLTQFAANNPGTLTSSTLYNALVTATNTIQVISAQYNIGGVVK